MSAPSTQAIFLSYAHEDTDAARRIADALRSHGLEVWFDQNELRGGDTWDQKIRRQIKECALFLPLVSANTQMRKEGYFRLEWKLAAERTHLMAEGVPFLTPIVADNITESGALVPGEFLRVQWTRLPGALVTPQFIEQIKRLLTAQSPFTQASTAETGSPRPVERGEGSASPTKAGRRVPAAAWSAAIAAIVVAVIAGALSWRRPAATASNAGAETRPPTAEKPAAPPPANILNKSIAILPLANMSEDKDTGFFADGVHEDLLTNLALVPDLKVVSRTSVMQYRGTTKTMKQIGEELGVAYILEGSVRRSGNKVRVTGQLINTRTDEHVWAKSYDRDLTDIFAIQAALSQEIAGALSAAISPQTQKFLERRPTENPVAYDFYLRGRDLRNRSPTGAGPALREEEALFTSAVQQDPKFAAAWGELAGVHALNAFWGRDGSAERLAKGDAAIAKATQLAPEAPDVIRSVGTYAYYAHRDYPTATTQYEKLARLQPNDPTVFESLGLIQRRQGRWAESLANLRRAVELDPANISYVRNVLASLVKARRWDEVRAARQRLVELLPGQLREQLALADGEFAPTGSLAAADALLARLTPAERDSPVAVFFRKGWAVARGDYAEFKRLDQVQPSFEEIEDPRLSAWFAVDVYAAMGDHEALRARIAGPLAEARAQTQREPANPRAWAYLAAFEALAGDPVEAVRLVRKAIEMLPLSRDAVDGPALQLTLAWIYAVTGDKDRAIAGIVDLLRVPGDWSVADLRVSPGFKSLLGDPRFQALLNDPKNNAPLF